MLVSTCQLANGSSSSSSSDLARVGVVGDVRLGVVVRRELELPAGLEVDVPQLDAAPPRLGLAATPAGRQGAHEVLVVEDGAAQPVERLGERFGHAGPYFTSAAITTMRINPPSATGMTSRR